MGADGDTPLTILAGTTEVSTGAAATVPTGTNNELERISRETRE